MYISELEDLFGNVEISQSTKERTINIIEVIGHILLEIGNYDDMVKQILNTQGRLLDSIINTHEEINIIPSDEQGECQEILLAFAHGRRSPKTGLGPIMRKVRAQLIRCGDSACRKQTRVAIIITNLWDHDVFIESVEDLKAHQETPPGKIIIGALVNKTNIIPQTII